MHSASDVSTCVREDPSWENILNPKRRGLTMIGIATTKVAIATSDAGPSSMYSKTIAPIILAGEEMTPRRFWQSCCRVSASEVTRLKILPLVNCCWAVGVSLNTFLKTWCTSNAFKRKPAGKAVFIILSWQLDNMLMKIWWAISVLPWFSFKRATVVISYMPLNLHIICLTKETEFGNTMQA